MTICMCFVFEVFLLVDMSLLVLSGPQPIWTWTLFFCFRSDEASPFCPDVSCGRERVFSLPTDIIFPQLYQKVFIISQIIMGGDSWGFFSFLAIIIILSLGSLLWPFCLKCLELSSQSAPSSQVGNYAMTSAAVTLVFADTTVAYEAAHKVFTDNLYWMGFSWCPEILGKVAGPFNCS